MTRNASRVLCRSMLMVALLTGGSARAGQDDDGARPSVRTQIEQVRTRPTSAAVRRLAERILAGLPPATLQDAMAALEAAGRKEAMPAVERLLRHRRGEVRAGAVSLLLACAPRKAEDALVAALDDPDPRVRGAAAEGLGRIRARRAVPVLFRALDRGMLEAAMPLAQLVDGAGGRRLLGFVGRVPFDVFGPVLTELVARGDLPLETRMEVVAHLESLATPEARTVLEAIAAALPERGQDARIRRAALQAAAHIAPGGGS